MYGARCRGTDRRRGGCALRRAGANTVEEVLVSASVNIIKNAMSAGIPGTSYEGMDYAAAIGAVGGEPVHLLEVMNYVAPEQVEQAAALVKAGKVKVEVAQVPQKLYVDVTVKGEGHTGRAVVRDLHTNVVLVQQDGETTLDKTNAAAQSPDGRDLVPPEEIAAFLTVKSIWDYCTEELDPLHDPIDIIRSAVKVNTAISEEGLSKEYGLAIGRNLELNCRKGLMTRDLTTNAMIIASGGADARMAGAPVSVEANSGQRQPGHYGHHACCGSGPLAGHRRRKDAAGRHSLQSHRHPDQIEVWPPEQPLRRDRPAPVPPAASPTCWAAATMKSAVPSRTWWAT